MFEVLLVVLGQIGPIDFYQEPPTPPQAEVAVAEEPDRIPDADTYGRAKAMAKQTQHAQAVLFVDGDKDAREVGSFLASLKARDIDLPHIVDLSAIDPKDAAEARSRITPQTDKPFLHTIHDAAPGYGPRWSPMTTPEKYLNWLGKCQNPMIYNRSRGSSYGSGYSGRRRMMFRRRSGG